MIINIVYNEMTAEKCSKKKKKESGMKGCRDVMAEVGISRCALDIGNLEKPSSRGNN